MGSSGVAYCIEKQIAQKRGLLHTACSLISCGDSDTLKSVDNQKCESILRPDVGRSGSEWAIILFTKIRMSQCLVEK